jgi:hypothetical protein
MQIRVKNKSGQLGTVIGQSHASWHVHWDGKPYETSEFGSIPKEQVELVEDWRLSPGWRPMASAPRDGSTILAWWEDSQTLAPIIWDGNESLDPDPPTHWLPIPRPPGWVE